MGESFQLSVSAVTRMADAFADRRETFHQIGAPLTAAAAAIDTGDAGLDAETREVVRRVTEMFALMGDTWWRLAGAVDTVVDNYQQGDQQVADSYRELMDDVPMT